LKLLLDLLFPRFCINCQIEGAWLCKKCAQLIDIIHAETCPQCEEIHKNNEFCYNCKRKLQQKSLPGIVWAVNYANPLAQKLIHYFKYKFIQETSQDLINLLLKKIDLMPIIQKKIQQSISVFLPVPLAKKRLRWRGFNQAEVLARTLCKSLKKDEQCIQTGILKKIKNTKPQAELKKLARKKNVQGAFLAEHNPVLKNKIVFLIDDVATTFSTLLEAHKALIYSNNKPKEVWGLVIARG